MNVSAPVSGLVFAVVVAVLLFGVFISPVILRRIRSWWHGIHLLPFDAASPVEKPVSGAAPPPARGYARRGKPPQLEKKQTIGHRSG